ncbi:MAG: cytochrome P450 [Nitrospirae bacterium]|nr:cytochrome P450 [Nitrospirota bacterium]
MRQEQLPVGPSAPMLFQTARMVRNPLSYLEQCRREFGDIFTLRIALGTMVHLTTPANIKVLFTGEPENLLAGEANYNLFGAISGRGTVFTMDGEAHLHRRRLLSPPFRGERMLQYTELMRDITEQVIATWPVHRPFALHPYMQQITLRVILAAVFGLEVGPQADGLSHLLAMLANVGTSSPLLLMPMLQWDLGRYSPWGRIVHLLKKTHTALDLEIGRRRGLNQESGSREDILSLLLEIKDEEEHPLTDQELRDELIVMLLAGHETTGTTLAWVFERILSEPDVLEKIRVELAAVVGNERLDRQNIARLEFLEATIKEAMRVRPIMPQAGVRKLAAPFEIAGYKLPAGTLVANTPHLLHRNPDLYPEPDRFLPERFLRRNVNPYEWTPFGGGVRRCLGMAFALHEIKVVLATVFTKIRLRLADSPVKVGRRGFFIAPADGTRVVVVGI